MTLSVYVINLDRRPDRWDVISRDLGCLGLPFERVPAVDARTLSGADNVSPLPFMNLGAVACIQSHAKALRRFLETDAEAALVLEDDAELAGDVPAMCESVDWWPAGTSAISLEALYEKRRLQGWLCGQTPSGRDLHMIVRWNSGAAAYLVNRTAAAMLVESYKKQELHPDRLMFDPRLSKVARTLRPVQVSPAAARQRKEYESDLVPWYERQMKKRWRRYMLLHRSPSWALRSMWWRATGRARRMRVPYKEVVG